MGVFLETISSFPTVPWTVLLGVVVLYWLLVILGALDLDVLDGLGGGGEALEGAGDGVAEGLAEGLGEGAAEGLGEGLGEGAAEGLADGAAEAGGGIADVVSALRLGSVPLTVVLSLTGVLAWILAYLGARGLSPLMQGPLGHWALGSGILVASGLCGLLLTSLILRPIVGRIPEERVRGGKALIGRVCKATTGRVDARFGQALLETGGAGLVLQVRCSDDNDLTRGDPLLIIDYDLRRQEYAVCRAPDELEPTRPRLLDE